MTSSSRTRNFVGGLSLGYLNTVIVTVVGLWLTPYLLRNLDQHDYGLWILTAQVLFYLALTDVGIVALLPRPEWTPVEIPVRRRDDCLDEWSIERIDLMKIDVEGAEPRVLAGGTVHLARGTVRHAMIEINGPRLVEAGSSPAALIDQLGALGFEPARLSHGRAMRVARTDVDLDPAREWDRLFVHTTTLRSAS